MRKKSRIGTKERIARGMAKARLAYKRWKRRAYITDIIDDALKHLEKAGKTGKLTDVETAIKKLREAVKATDAFKQECEKKGLKAKAEEIEKSKQLLKKVVGQYNKIFKKILESKKRQEKSKKRQEKYREN